MFSTRQRQLVPRKYFLHSRQRLRFGQLGILDSPPHGRHYGRKCSKHGCCWLLAPRRRWCKSEGSAVDNLCRTAEHVAFVTTGARCANSTQHHNPVAKQMISGGWVGGGVNTSFIFNVLHGHINLPPTPLSPSTPSVLTRRHDDMVHGFTPYAMVWLVR